MTYEEIIDWCDFISKIDKLDFKNMLKNIEDKNSFVDIITNKKRLNYYFYYQYIDCYVPKFKNIQKQDLLIRVNNRLIWDLLLFNWEFEEYKYIELYIQWIINILKRLICNLDFNKSAFENLWEIWNWIIRLEWFLDTKEYKKENYYRYICFWDIRDILWYYDSDDWWRKMESNNYVSWPTWPAIEYKKSTNKILKSVQKHT